MDNMRCVDTIRKLDELLQLIEESKPSFLSGKITVDQDEVIARLKDIRFNIPTEFSQSVWITNERMKILAEAENDAEQIRQDARQESKRLIEKSEITQFARERAGCIIETAEVTAKEIQQGSIAYAQDALQDMENSLKATLDMVHKEVQNFEANITNLLGEAFDHRQELKDMNDKLDEIEE